ncbi:MAG: hypothetical protein Q7S19_01545 [bacterium]|nr:hypothetical protein [bacterium]
MLAYGRRCSITKKHNRTKIRRKKPFKEIADEVAYNDWVRTEKESPAKIKEEDLIKMPEEQDMTGKKTIN